MTLCRITALYRFGLIGERTMGTDALITSHGFLLEYRTDLTLTLSERVVYFYA
jgi:hypothetical protein